MAKEIKLPLTKEIITTLKAGDELLLSGPLLTARDTAHKRLYDAIKAHRRLPVDLKGETIYYTGPAPKRPGEVIGSCGPTTSARMDRFTPTLLEAGLSGMIGKGPRSQDVIDAINRFGSVYMVTIGGAGAYLSQRIKKSYIIAYEDLGPEAIYRLVIEDFPAIVAVDSKGGLYGA